MAKIDLLRTNIDDMSPEQKLMLIRKIREDRKIKKAPEKVKKAKNKKSNDVAKKLAAAMAGMTDEEKAAFLQSLEEENVEV